jgi:alkylation response protein AidB-like acyl-CoA dehydrogenase
VDLQLTEEQRWLAESVDELLARGEPDTSWPSLVEFGALEIGGDDGLGVVELALVARSIGEHLAAVPYVDSASVGYVVDIGAASAAPCLDEPGRSFAPTDPSTSVDDGRLTGEKAAVPFAGVVELLAVSAATADGPVLAVVPAASATIAPEPTLDTTVQPALVSFDGADVDRIVGERAAIESLAAVGGVLASAEAVGAAARVLELAREYASQRRQFGRTIGSFQAVRHILADLYVKVESSWSSVLYAAASLDESEADALRTASIAKAYASRATLDVAHGALQVFGGIAFTAEHPAHRYLRRIVVRGGQFGAARDHERSLGRSLAHELEVLT